MYCQTFCTFAFSKPAALPNRLYHACFGIPRLSSGTEGSSMANDCAGLNFRDGVEAWESDRRS